MIKKIIPALFLVLSSAAALAAQTNNSMPIASDMNLIAPHQEGSWSFGLQASHLEPDTDYNYFHLASDTPDFFPILDGDSVYTVGSDYNWGWGADISYHFPGNGRDVNLAFTQLNTSHSDSATDPNRAITFASPPIVFSQSGKHSAEVDTNYNAADLTFGQLIEIGQRLSLHPFAGLRYASIDYKAESQRDDTYNFNIEFGPGIGVTFTDNTKDESTWESDFQGLGPRFGSDAEFNLGRGFSLRSTLGLSLLVGDLDVREKGSANELVTLSFEFPPFPPGSIILSDQTTNTNNEIQTNTRVVPEADAKLSAVYKTDVNNNYSLSFEAGYQVTNYFDAVENSVMSTQDTSTQYSNYFIQGPYARMQLDVA